MRDMYYSFSLESIEVAIVFKVKTFCYEDLWARDFPSQYMYSTCTLYPFFNHGWVPGVCVWLVESESYRAEFLLAFPGTNRVGSIRVSGSCLQPVLPQRFASQLFAVLLRIVSRLEAHELFLQCFCVCVFFSQHFFNLPFFGLRVLPTVPFCLSWYQRFCSQMFLVSANSKLSSARSTWHCSLF